MKDKKELFIKYFVIAARFVTSVIFILVVIQELFFPELVEPYSWFEWTVLIICLIGIWS